MRTLLSLALAVTLIVEVPIVVAFYPRQRLRMALACVVVTVLTSVVLNLAIVQAHLGRDVSLLVGEGGALLVEAAVYVAVARPEPEEAGWPRAIVAAGVANLASYIAGLLLF